MLFSKLSSFLIAALPLASAAVIKRNNNYKNVLYWGQGNDYQKSLASYCASGSGVDFIVLAFIDHFGNGAYPSGQIGACSINSDQSYSDECADVAKDIQTCKNNGIKVFLSIGGSGADSTWHLNGDGDAKGVAYSLWHSYANPAYVDKGTPRPFGNVFVDGWDIDLESQGGDGSPNSYKYLGSLLNNLRGYFSRDSSHSYYIAGAPQCPMPEANMGLSMNQAKYDYLWIQFYNNNCAANDLFKDSNQNPNGAGYFNLKDWPKYLSNGASKNAKLIVGLPGAPDAADNFDYVQPKNLASLVSQSQNVPNFAGIMIYDAGAISESTTNGKNYAQLVKAALNNA